MILIIDVLMILLCSDVILCVCVIVFYKFIYIYKMILLYDEVIRVLVVKIIIQVFWVNGVVV